MIIPNKFVLDVDGTLTSDNFIYSKKGKEFKLFGPDDADALKILQKYLDIVFITADKRGLDISKKRVNDMGFNIYYVGKSKNRLSWLEKKFNLNRVIYMGDSFTDIPIFKKVYFSVTPNNCFYLCKKYVNLKTKHSSGSRSIAEACEVILKKFFNSSLIKEI